MRNRLLQMGALVAGAGSMLAVGVAANGPPDAKVTFTKDVAPIFYSRCAECHRPGEVAPMSLLSYSDARPWAKAIKQKVLDRSHMHVRGKDFTYTAVYPDGRSEVVLSVPKYDFNWQLLYQFKEPLLLPKGSRLDCVAHFDNSVTNKYNPDPTKEVRWGDQTWEEMMIGWFDYILDKENLVERAGAR